MTCVCSDNLIRLCFVCVIFLELCVSQKPQGQCENQGELGTPSCCLNYINIDGDCIACLPGTMGKNCSSLCPDGFYGQFCLKKCNCHPTQRCSKAKGCICKGDNCSSVPDTFDVAEGPPCKSNDAIVIALVFIIISLLFFLVPITVHVYRLRKLRNKIRSPTGYVQTDIRQDGEQLHSYEAMSRKDLPLTNDVEMEQYEQPTNVSKAGNGNYLEPQQATIKPVVHTGQLQQTEQNATPNTDHSSVKVSDLPGKTSHMTSSESHKTVTLVAKETSAEDNEESTEDNEESYLDMGHKKRLDYLDVIASGEQVQEQEPNTPDGEE